MTSSVLFFHSSAYSEHMAIRMPQMHFTHSPRFVGRGHGDIESRRDAHPVHLIDVFDPQRHPHALVGRFIAVVGEGSRVQAFAAPALCALAQKYANLAGFDRSKRGGTAPVPKLLPAPGCKPCEAGGDVGNIQYGSYALGSDHLISRPARIARRRLQEG